MQVVNIKFSVLLFFITFMACRPGFGEEFFTQIGEDPTWETIMKDKLIPIGSNSTAGIKGSKIDVKNEIFHKLTYGKYDFTQDIRIHTVGNSQIQRPDFEKWSRWYQEDGNTQVFRMHKGERNVRGTRAGTPAGRVEAFGNHTWGKGAWQEWVGTYTIVKPEGCVGPHYCSILQVKDPVQQWAIMIRLKDNGDIVISNDKKESPMKPIASNMKGKHFDLRVRDNGHNYQVFFNEKLVNEGSFSRSSKTAFRWGLYLGRSLPTAEAMIFVTGATINPQSNAKPLSIAHPTYQVRPGLQSTSRGMVLNSHRYPAEIAIFDMQGGLVWQRQVMQPQEMAAIGLPSGGYIAEIKTPDARHRFPVPSLW